MPAVHAGACCGRVPLRQLDAANAALETAELNLEFTHVRSLVDGVAAIATAQIGDLVGPTTLLTTVSQVEPIKAYVPVSETEYLVMAGRIRHGAIISARTDAPSVAPGQSRPPRRR